MLRLVNLTKTFHRGTVNEKVALDRINLEVGPGDFVTIVGSNGAGKSSMLNAIAGAWPIDSGQILWNDINLGLLPDYCRARYVGRVFQDPMMGTAGSMTVEENMALAVRRGLSRNLGLALNRNLRARFKQELLRLGLGLESRLGTPARLLSGGQKQALTLIMATMQKPEILLLDEHTASLDPKTAVKVMDLTVQLVAEYRIPTLMVTHNLNNAFQVGNRTIMMHHGQIVFDIRGQEREQITYQDAIKLFERHSGQAFCEDRMLLPEALA